MALGLTVLVAAAIGFGILELGLRAAGFTPWERAPMPYVPLMQEPDPELGWRNLPGRYVFGKSEAIEMTFWPGGSRATGPEPLAQERQVLVLGGSFTQGWAVSDAETYAYRLQEAFPGVEGRNLGTAGYGTLQALLALERALEAAPRAPALVLYGFNDFHDTRNVATPQWLRMLSRVSQLGTVSTPYASLDADEGLIRHVPARYPDWPLKRRLAAVALFEEWVTEVSGIARSQSAVAVTEALLLEMDRVTRAAGSRLLVVALSGFDPKARDRYMAFLRRSRIDVLDCTYPDDGTRQLLVPDYGHPNATVNLYWASCIQPALAQSLSAP